LIYALIVVEETEEDEQPQTYCETISSTNSSNWLIAMHEEIESLHKNDT